MLLGSKIIEEKSYSSDLALAAGARKLPRAGVR